MPRANVASPTAIARLQRRGPAARQNALAHALCYLGSPCIRTI
ncbi:hypothetical protein XAP6164_5250002 [Xanthomonas phaseoli pv. phaseoli]|nr:hypothetical protein XAP6164_5250002 [Xanthomonas phaseoli pv. phaseoli]